MKLLNKIQFPTFSGIRCLMMPFIQGDSKSIPEQYKPYEDIINNVFIKKNDIGYLTIDESLAKAGNPHRGNRAKFDRALHTEAGITPDALYRWGSSRPAWGGSAAVLLDENVEVLLANNIDNTCALWDATCKDTTLDGDIGHKAAQFPYSEATMMKAGEVFKIGILTPHESLPVIKDTFRQFLRIVGAGVHGREPYFTTNPLMTA